MKKMLLTLVAMIGMTFPAQAMTYNQARTEALFLTDKMAYELALSNDQYEVVYEINFDYFYSLVGQTDLYGIAWQRRDSDLKYVLTVAQYERMIARDYFYRPVSWNSGWNFTIYTHYTNRYHMYYARPVAYGSYRGGHSWRHNNNQSYYQTRSYYYSKNIRQHSGNRNHSGYVPPRTNNKPATSGHNKPWTGNQTTTTHNNNHQSGGSTWRNTGSNNRSNGNAGQGNPRRQPSTTTSPRSASGKTGNSGGGHFGTRK